MTTTADAPARSDAPVRTPGGRARSGRLLVLLGLVALVLVAALAEYFPRIADDAGARLRRLHEESVAGSRELDESGRLVDDRHIPELLNFAYDFDTEYLNAVLLRPGPFDARAVLTQVARKHSLDPDAFATGQDHVGCWWHAIVQHTADHD